MLFNSKNGINIIYVTFTKKICFFIKLININIQKIDDIILDTYKMVIVAFSITDQANWIIFFKKTSLVANVSLKVIFEIVFFILNNINVDFLEKKLK